MHSQYLISLFAILCIAHEVLSVPTKLKFSWSNKLSTPKNKKKEERQNHAKVISAGTLANTNSKKMAHVLDTPDFPGRQEMIDAAFGTDESLDMQQVRQTVGRLADDNAKVPVHLATDHTLGSYGVTYYKGKNPMQPKVVKFTGKFYSDQTSNDARAATLIHESTHYLSDTGDHSHHRHMLPGSDPRKTSAYMYTFSEEPYKTPAALNDDETWTKLRDERTLLLGDHVPAMKNMHLAAESYAQFSSMCGHAVPDDVVARRGLEAKYWDQAAIHLIRRRVCSLPKKGAYGQKVTQGKSRITSTKLGKKKPTGARDTVIKSKTSAQSSRSKSRVSGMKSKSQGLSNSRTTKAITQGLGSVRASASVKRPRLKVSASKSSVKTSQAPRQIVARPASKAPAKSASKSNIRPVPKSTLITVAKGSDSAKRTVPPKAVVPKVVPKPIGTQKKVRRDLTSRF